MIRERYEKYLRDFISLGCPRHLAIIMMAGVGVMHPDGRRIYNACVKRMHREKRKKK